jgi:hypothetical protein
MQEFSREERIRYFSNPVVQVQAPKIIAKRTVFENGRIITKMLIDGSRLRGRGYAYWLNSGADPYIN